MDCRRVWRTNVLYVVPYIHLIVRHFRCKIPLPPPKKQRKHRTTTTTTTTTNANNNNDDNNNTNKNNKHVYSVHALMCMQQTL